MIAIGVITIVLVFVILGVVAIRRDLTHLRRQAESGDVYVVNGVITHIPTEDELEKLSDANWLSIPDDQRLLCKAYIRATVPDSVWLYWKKGFPPGFHFGGGMAVRNCLRDVLLDENLPRDKNWDDYYMGCLREILREMK
jgi:hypothetical protein